MQRTIDIIVVVENILIGISFALFLRYFLEHGKDINKRRHERKNKKCAVGVSVPENKEMKGFEDDEALEAVLKYCDDNEEELAEAGIYKCTHCGKWFIDFDYTVEGFTAPVCLKCALKYAKLGGL